MKSAVISLMLAENQRRQSPDLLSTSQLSKDRNSPTTTPNLSYKINFNRPEQLEKLNTVDFTTKLPKIQIDCDIQTDQPPLSTNRIKSRVLEKTKSQLKLEQERSFPIRFPQKKTIKPLYNFSTGYSSPSATKKQEFQLNSPIKVTKTKKRRKLPKVRSADDFLKSRTPEFFGSTASKQKPWLSRNIINPSSPIPKPQRKIPRLNLRFPYECLYHRSPRNKSMPREMEEMNRTRSPNQVGGFLG